MPVHDEAAFGRRLLEVDAAPGHGLHKLLRATRNLPEPTLPGEARPFWLCAGCAVPHYKNVVRHHGGGLYKRLYDSMFSLTPYMKHLLDLEATKIFQRGKHVIGLQIRTEFNSKWPRAWVSCAEAVVKQKNITEPLIFYVASDDSNAINTLRKQHPRYEFLTAEGHVGRIAERDSLHSFTKLLLDQHLLGMTDTLITTDFSTFGDAPVLRTARRETYTVLLSGKCIQRDIASFETCWTNRRRPWDAIYNEMKGTLN
eukprot:TRINITY_DN1555_c0_g1_i4.p1 TRINITY_DN1555_c0_g1~~TRINITY_DN1555_c0_g1_i4.p1  ORF type:complete len:267 (+),score=40.45 TRINITY_DN1555_c0_g1_i4:34-801(+)